MRITPLDVRKQEFRRSVRGFDCDEVRAFLSTLADEYETVLVDNKQLREHLSGIEEKVSEYKTMERTLRDTLMTAERLMQDTRASANKEGDLIIQDSRLQAKRILEECRVRTEELRRELNGLRKEKETYLARFKTLAETQIQFVECHRSDFDDLDRRLIDMVDSAIEGMGAHAAPSAAEVAPQAAPAVAPVTVAPTAAVTVPAAPAWMNESARAQETAVPAAQAAPTHDEVDRWRDYKPDVAEEAPAAPAASPVPVVPEQETASAAPIVDIPTASAATVEPAPVPETPARQPWSNQGWDKSADETSMVRPSEAPVNGADLAMLGIPVPAGNSIDGTEEAVATLVETAVEKANTEPVAPWGG